MARTGDDNAALLADVAHARKTDGNSSGGFERVVRMAQAAALVHEAKDIGSIRPDLADEDVDFHADAKRDAERIIRTLIRPTGPVQRLSNVGVVVRRDSLGLGRDTLPE